MPEAKRVFIAATRQNDGKTVFSIGLLLTLQKYFGKRVGFMKPVGQKYIVIDGVKVDKDAVLMQKICGIEDDLKDINPVAVEEGFTRNYLDAPDPSGMVKLIKESYERISRDKDIVIIEGTGHAGVGSVFDMSNADVACLLDAPVVIISIGGIGKPIDEVSLNLSLFKEKKVNVKGVVINKVLQEKKQLIEKYLSTGFTRIGIKLLGVMPFVPLMLQPNFCQICECVNGKAIIGQDRFHIRIQNVIIGAMTPRHAMDYFKPGSLLVTPGDREDMILAAIESHSSNEIVGMVLTGGLYPHKSILDIIKKYNIPTIITSAGTYEAASSINQLVVKVTEKDVEKIEMAQKLVEENVNIEELLR